MQLLPLSNLGPREVAPDVMRFGLLLPWVSAANGNQLSVKIIHEADQFLQDIPALEFPMAHSPDPQYGDLWSAQVTIDPSQRPTATSAWGTAGTYVYRYQLRSPQLSAPLDWIVDPFAREFGVGKLAAFTPGFRDHAWSPGEASWKTPRLSELIVYELMLHEFQGDLRGAARRLPYLKDLGVNCVEVMPITNVESTLNWGFEPIGYFGVDERFGNRRDFQAFVDEAHRNGIAVVLDVVYGQTGLHFGYEHVYSRLGYQQHPFMGAFGDADMFGPSTDWRRAFVQDYFFTVNQFWLEKCHVDGFRYDCVPNYWDGPTGVGYANLVYHTYRSVRAQAQASTPGDPGGFARFIERGEFNLIQCAEQLQKPLEAVWDTYSNATWQNATIEDAKAVASGDRGRLYALGMDLGLKDYPGLVTHNGDALATTAFQYLENHDHPRFLTQFGVDQPGDEPFPALFRHGDRSKWYKLQPYLIALFTCRGVPLLWQGQELGADNVVADRGLARIGVLRPVPWEYFYDEHGRAVLTLVRRLTKLRRASPELQSGSHYFYNDWERYQSKGALLFSRSDAQRFTLVALNFTDDDVDVPFTFDRSAQSVEALHGVDNFQATAGQERWLHVPSNYGRIWSLS